MNDRRGVEKLETGVAGLDVISMGGLPAGRTTLVAGSAGSGKTLLAAQFLAAGINEKGQAGVFVTFEETPEAIRSNLVSMGWDVDGWEREGRWAFVDVSAQLADEEAVVVGGYDMGALLARIESAVSSTGAERVVLDSLGAVITRFGDSATVRGELLRVTNVLKRLGVTAMMTAERIEEYGPISRQGVEDFVADNVIVLRNVLEDEKRRRTVEVLKFRGASHQKGEFPFTILPQEGFVVIPLSEVSLEHESTDLRIASGSKELDEM